MLCRAETHEEASVGSRAAMVRHQSSAKEFGGDEAQTKTDLRSLTAFVRRLPVWGKNS